MGTPVGRQTPPPAAPQPYVYQTPDAAPRPEAPPPLPPRRTIQARRDSDPDLESVALRARALFAGQPPAAGAPRDGTHEG